MCSVTVRQSFFSYKEQDFASVASFCPLFALVHPTTMTSEAQLSEPGFYSLIIPNTFPLLFKIFDNASLEEE